MQDTLRGKEALQHAACASVTNTAKEWHKDATTTSGSRTKSAMASFGGPTSIHDCRPEGVSFGWGASHSLTDIMQAEVEGNILQLFTDSCQMTDHLLMCRVQRLVLLQRESKAIDMVPHAAC